MKLNSNLIILKKWTLLMLIIPGAAFAGGPAPRRIPPAPVQAKTDPLTEDDRLSKSEKASLRFASAFIKNSFCSLKEVSPVSLSWQRDSGGTLLYSSVTPDLTISCETTGNIKEVDLHFTYSKYNQSYTFFAMTFPNMSPFHRSLTDLGINLIQAYACRISVRSFASREMDCDVASSKFQAIKFYFRFENNGYLFDQALVLINN